MWLSPTAFGSGIWRKYHTPDAHFNELLVVGESSHRRSYFIPIHRCIVLEVEHVVRGQKSSSGAARLHVCIYYMYLV